jgi:hypothetical protein
VTASGSRPEKQKTPDVQLRHTFCGFLEASGVVETSEKH